jgi:hypothetical protein
MMTRLRPCTSLRRAPLGTHLTLKGRNFRFVKEVKYFFVIFDSKMTWRKHIDSIVTKALQTYIRIYSLLKIDRLSAKSKLTLYKALIRSEMTYDCPTWEFAANSPLLKLPACEIESSAPLVTYQGSHRTALYIGYCRLRTSIVT